MNSSFENEQSEPQGKVLFVDDEISILKSIRRSFFNVDFEVFTASGVEEGLELLEKEQIDIVVSDFRMPVMDGIQFLKIVKEKHPSISRIILSGYVEHAAVVRALVSGTASTYIAKPWDDAVLEARIIHILDTQKILRDKKLLNLINSIEKLPTLPSIYQEFTEAIENEKSIKEISEIIKKDASISAKVLQIANSAFYGLKGTTSISHAMAYLGLNPVKDIVLTVSLTNKMQWNELQTQHLRDIFRHAALVNRYIPKFYNLCEGAPVIKQFPAVGLTHDIGKIILLQYYPDRYESILANMKKNPGMDFYASELDLGFHENTHTEIGAFFLDWWNMPEIIMEVALFHHTPAKSADQYYDILEISRFTDKLVNYLWSMRGKENLDISDFHCGNLSGEIIKKLAADIKEEIDEQDI